VSSEKVVHTDPPPTGIPLGFFRVSEAGSPGFGTVLNLCSANTTSVGRLGAGRRFVQQSRATRPAGSHTGAMPRRRLLVDVITLAGFAVTSRSKLVAENLFLRKQLALYQAPCQTETTGSGHTSGSCPALTPAGLARAPHSGPARHAHPVASSGLAAPLAAEVVTRTTAHSEGVAATHRERGPGEPDPG
jgi:hypothetical protein